MNTDKVTRFELITEDGRSVVEYNCEVELSLQDAGQTLKVFLKRREQEVIPVIEDLDDTKVYPIGFKFRYKGNLLEIAEVANGCNGCAFQHCGFRITACFSSQRLNKDSIIFKQTQE